MADTAQPAKQVTVLTITYNIYKINRINQIFLFFTNAAMSLITVSETLPDF
jgi:hypothetical protein